MNLNLQGRVALVTGGARDVGRDIALQLAAEGAAVAVNYHKSKDKAEALVAEIQRHGGRAQAIRANVADIEAVRALVDATVKAFGGLNILINNAGLVFRKRFSESTPEEWRQQIDVCLYGTLNCCHAAIPHLEKSGNGRIIALAGDSSRVGESGLALAAASRAGNIALMKSLARELGRSGTTANAIALGLVETSHAADFVEANREKLTKLYPLRRLGKASDVAPLVALLASDAGGWITGQTISISGGFTMI